MEWVEESTSSRKASPSLRNLFFSSPFPSLDLYAFTSATSVLLIVIWAVDLASRLMEIPTQSCLAGGSSSNRDAGNFQCNICSDLAQEPVVTLCGHLFCWPCLYEWLHGHSRSSECPVCKATIAEEEIVPLYCGGNSSTHPQARSTTRVDIPSRPAAGRRLATAYANHIYHHDTNHIHHTGWLDVGDSLTTATRFELYLSS
ncbi:zinc finger, C3HC4 type, domain containing protein [Musa troglodytarum]|uniref:E3 ubiquitin-protein ligase RMA n=1 Tax=Musa troglodytarum TaxID=320322 RepID=A0A9E7H4Q0_9LILI|nr:zinc finger, C3HC4 type, domain containing protein [Musa troglodytarum]